MKKNFLDKKGLAAPQILVVVLIIAAILGAGWLLNKDYSTNSTTNNSAKTDTSTTPTSTSGTFTFKEFGVKVALPPALNGLKYTASAPPAAANAPSIVLLKLNNDEYTKLANKCVGAPDGTEQSFATLIKTPVVGNAPPSVENLKQFNDFYIGNLGGALKDPVCKDAATKKSLTDLTNKLNAALKESFQTAQKV